MTGQQVMARLRERDTHGEECAMAKRIAHAHSVTIDEMLGESHEPLPSAARHTLWWALYVTGRWSFPRLGKTFGRDHTTIMAGVKSHCERAGIPVPKAGRGKDYAPPEEARLRQEVS